MRTSAAATFKYTVYSSNMGLENDADLKRLREELQKERERVERLEKEVRKEVFILKVHFTWK